MKNSFSLRPIRKWYIPLRTNADIQLIRMYSETEESGIAIVHGPTLSSQIYTCVTGTALRKMRYRPSLCPAPRMKTNDRGQWIHCGVARGYNRAVQLAQCNDNCLSIERGNGYPERDITMCCVTKARVRLKKKNPSACSPKKSDTKGRKRGRACEIENSPRRKNPRRLVVAHRA